MEAARAKEQAEEAKAQHEKEAQYEKKAAAVGVTKYEAHMKTLVPMGEPITALGLDSEIDLEFHCCQ